MQTFLEGLGSQPVAIAAITASELLHGWERAGDPSVKERRGRFVEAILASVPIATFGLDEARYHARVWAELASEGNLIGPHDMMIAATALALDFSLASMNEKEFRRVGGLRLTPAA